MRKKSKKSANAEVITLPAVKTKQEIKKILATLDGQYSITDAAIKDGFCNYNYDIMKGIGAPGSHGVKGKNLFKDDLQDAFNKLRVHLAVVDCAFALSKIEIKDLDQFHVHDITLTYEVTGIKVKGLGDNEAVIIVGNKYVGAFGRMDLESPRISMEASAGYKWYNELKAAVDLIREEVSLYNEGYYTPTETSDDDEEDENQIKMTFQGTEDDDEFEKDKV